MFEVEQNELKKDIYYLLSKNSSENSSSNSSSYSSENSDEYDENFIEEKQDLFNKHFDNLKILDVDPNDYFKEYGEYTDIVIIAGSSYINSDSDISFSAPQYKFSFPKKIIITTYILLKCLSMVNFKHVSKNHIWFQGFTNEDNIFKLSLGS